MVPRWIWLRNIVQHDIMKFSRCTWRTVSLVVNDTFCIFVYTFMCYDKYYGNGNVYIRKKKKKNNIYIYINIYT